jgi:drug/metabolite transporter (DMT)-like permease
MRGPTEARTVVFAVAGILASLYPAGTVLLAVAILHERIHLLQGLGLGLCAFGVACVAAG